MRYRPSIMTPLNLSSTIVCSKWFTHIELPGAVLVPNVQCVKTDLCGNRDHRFTSGEYGYGGEALYK